MYKEEDLTIFRVHLTSKVSKERKYTFSIVIANWKLLPYLLLA